MNTVKSSPAILMVGDSPFATTGFGRVMGHLAEGLIAANWDVHICAIHDKGDPRPNRERLHIWPCLSEPDAVMRAVEAAQGCQPDLIFLFSDVSVCGQWAQALAQASKDGKIPVPVLCYFPVDGGGMVPGLIEWMAHTDWFSTLKVATYTNWGKAVFDKAAKRLFGDTPFPFGECAVLPHAADTNLFKPEDVMVARKRLGLDTLAGESFILLSANTNTPRKNLDLVIAGFARFLAQTPEAVEEKARLWMHCNPQGTWDIPALMQRECADMGIDAWDNHLILSKDRANELHAGTDEAMRAVYNASSAGISASGGEGWGLTSWEHAACKRPQIVVDYAAHGEIFPPGSAYKIAPTMFRTAPIHLQVHAIVSPDVVASAIKACYEDWSEGGVSGAEEGYKVATALSWETVGEQFYEMCWDALAASGRAL